MSVLFDVRYLPTNLSSPDSRLEEGKTYGVTAIIESPECFWPQYRLEGVEGTFMTKDFENKRYNFFARSPSSFIPQEGTCIRLYGLSVLDDEGNWTSDYSNRIIEKVIPYAKNFYVIITAFGIYHTHFLNL